MYAQSVWFRRRVIRHATANYDASTGTLTLSGSDTLAGYQLVLRTVAFNSTNSDPTQGGRYPARTIAWTLNDGGLSSSAAITTVAMLPRPPENEVAIAAATNSWLLIFSGTPGQDYKVQFADAVNGPWADLSSVVTADSGGVVEYNDPTLPPSPMRFYRVRTAP
jgi:hypothetical protein